MGGVDYDSHSNYPLKPQQHEVMDFVRLHNYCIVALKMGGGKTLIGIVTSLMNGGRTVVVCPSFLKYNWKKEYKKFSKKDLKIAIVFGHNIKKINPKEYDVIILNYAIIGRCEKFFVDATTVIYDESHYLLNPKAARTKSAVKYTKTYEPKKMMLMTGTPNRGKGHQWYVPLFMCSINPAKNSGIDMRDHIFTYWDFQHTFCNKTIMDIGGREITQFTGIKNTDKLKKLLRNKMIVGKKQSLGIELNFKDVYVDYKTNDDELAKAWEDHEAGNPIAEHIMSAKSASALAKAKFTCEYVKNLIDSGEGPVVIFTDHRDSLDAIFTELDKKYAIGKINGSTKMETRNALVEDFEAGSLDVIAATVKAMNTGVTLVRSNNMVINDSNWTFTEMDQAYHRIFRIGQTKDCTVHNILGSEVDKNIIKNIKKGNEIINKILGEHA